MKNWIIITLCICLSLSITACSQRDDTKEPVVSQSQSVSENPSTPPDQIVSEQPVSSGDSNNPSDELDEYGLPVMSTENQQIYDKYFMPDNAAISIFQSNFDKNHVEHFLPEAAYAYLVDQKENAEIPQDEVESLLMRYFPFSAEMIHAQANKYYDLEKQTYSIWSLLPSEQSIHGAVTSSNITGDTLIVDCVWYWSAYPDNPSTYEPYATSQTVIIIKSDTEWFYESNQATREPPPSE